MRRSSTEHYTEWEIESDWDVAKTYISEGTEKKQDDANKALMGALKEFRDSVLSFAKTEGMLLTEVEGAAKEWFSEKWDEVFEEVWE
jgi:hypothetical protein